jgi:hypothetical protein
MATNFEWVKLILDKWAVILPALLFLASALGWTVDSIGKTTEIKKMQKNYREGIEAVTMHTEIRAPNKKCNCKHLLKLHKDNEH